MRDDNLPGVTVYVSYSTLRHRLADRRDRDEFERTARRLRLDIGLCRDGSDYDAHETRDAVEAWWAGRESGRRDCGCASDASARGGS